MELYVFRFYEEGNTLRYEKLYALLNIPIYKQLGKERMRKLVSQFLKRKKGKNMTFKKTSSYIHPLILSLNLYSNSY